MENPINDNVSEPIPSRSDASTCRLQVADLSIQDRSASPPLSSAPAVSFVNESSKSRRSHRDKRDKNKHIQEAAAETAALYYGECYVEGVGGSVADRAAVESHEQYKKWWLQNFNTGHVVSSVGDAHVVPRYNKNNPPSDTTSDASANNTATDPHKDEGGKDLDEVSSNSYNNLMTIPDETVIETSGKNYYSVTDFEYDQNNWTVIGGSANAAATEALRNDFNVVSSQQSTSHINNYDERRKIVSTETNYEEHLIAHEQNLLERIDRSQGASNPPPELRSIPMNENNNPIQSEISDLDKKVSSSGTTRKKRHRQKSLDYENLSSFFSLERPSASTSPQDANDRKEKQNSRKEQHEISRKESTYSDYETLNLPRSHSSSFFHEASATMRRLSSGRFSTNHFTKNSSFTQDPLIPSDNDEASAILTSMAPPKERTAKHVDNAKLSLLHALAVSGGDVTSKQFLFALEQLRTLYNVTDWDARDCHNLHRSTSQKTIEGMWLNLSRPHFNECIGKNSTGEYMYTMGRMSFDMFTPGNLICSIQGIFNNITTLDMKKDHHLLKSVPRSLREEIDSGKSVLRSYDIVTAFTVEPDSPQFGESSPNRKVYKSLRGIITTYGYVLPDPKTPNRLSIWFSGGKIEANEDDNQDLDEWKKAFGGGSFHRHLHEKARLLAAKLLLGAEVPEKMEDDGSMSFSLNRPIGGHGTAYVDVLYLDDTLRIVQGHRGSLFVFSRIS